MATDRLLSPSAGLKQLTEIKQTKKSSHEVTVQLNKIVLMLRQKQIQEAKKELDEVARLSADAENIRDERFLILKAYITFM